MPKNDITIFLKELRKLKRDLDHLTSRVVRLTTEAETFLTVANRIEERMIAQDKQ